MTAHDDTGGQTFYFGSPRSERRIRVYDKAREMKILNEAWTRVELQTRKPRASVLVAAMSEYGIPDAGDTALNAFVDFRCIPAFAQAMTTETIPIDAIPRKTPAWQYWMEQQVLKSIEQHAHEPQDNEFLQQWLMEAHQIVKRGYEALRESDTLPAE